LFPYDYPLIKSNSNYFWDYLNSRFICLDVVKDNTAQVTWLINLLKDANSKKMWIFVFFHINLFSSGWYNTYNSYSLINTYVPIFDLYNPIVFYGHDNLYEVCF
jgi:hypothetical protein